MIVIAVVVVIVIVIIIIIIIVATIVNGADSRKRFGKIREQHMGNVLSCAKRRKVILAI